MAITQTFHEMYQKLFEETKCRIQAAKESYESANARKRKGIDSGSEKAVANEVAVQEGLNCTMEQLNKYMRNIVALAKTHDKDLIPTHKSYEVYNRDVVGITFSDNSGGDDFTAKTHIAKIADRACSAEILGMRKSKRREKLVMAVNYQLNSGSYSGVRFMTAADLYAARENIYGKKGVSSTCGRVGPINSANFGFTDAEKGLIKFGGELFDLSGGVAVPEDFGAIWVKEKDKPQYKWLWYRLKEN